MRIAQRHHASASSLASSSASSFIVEQTETQVYTKAATASKTEEVEELPVPSLTVEQIQNNKQQDSKIEASTAPNSESQVNTTEDMKEEKDMTKKF